jgi:hypothetical protein
LKGAAAPHLRDLMGDTPVYLNDKKAMPLQAADLLASWILKWERDKIQDWADLFPFPWEQKRKMPRIVAYFGRKSFLADISDFLRECARSDEELEYAKSLMPSDWA